MEKTKPPNFTITIVRPSIIGGAYKYPFPGWTETVTASNAFLLFSGLGIVRYVLGTGENIADIIPVDIVADTLIVASIVCANKNNMNVFNCGSSSRNPFLWS